VTVHRRLALANPDAHAAELAKALENLADEYRKADRRDDAAAATKEAAVVIRQLAQRHPDAYGSEFTMSAFGLSVTAIGSDHDGSASENLADPSGRPTPTAPTKTD
jgi:hypothetical protein